MIIFKKSIPRRTFLRGLGVGMALPALDAMIPALARAADIKPPLRVGYFYSPNGIVRDYFRPVKAGSDYEMTDILRPWEPFRDQLLVLSNLDTGEPENISGHSNGATMFLTSAAPNKSLSNINAGISVDQAIAQELGKETPLGSLQLCMENAAELAGQDEGGYSFAYTCTISWRSPTTPLPMERRPREVFERLFGDAGTDQASRQARIYQKKSVLDFIRNETRQVLSELGADDVAKLNEFTDALRDVEIRIQQAETKTDMILPDMELPVGIPPHEEHLRLMYDLMHLAYQTDMTRVITFMVARESSEQVYTQLGHMESYHPLTHHRENPQTKRKAAEIDIYHARMFGEFLAKMRGTRDADGSTLLDNSMLMYGAGLGDGNLHSLWNISAAVLGGGRGTIKGGRHIIFEPGTPLSNLHVAMLNKAGKPTESFGGKYGISSGELDLSRPA